MRYLGLALALFTVGCSTTPSPEASGAAPRPVPERIVDDVRVVGGFDAEAVRAITALIRAETDEPILSIRVPTELFMPWRYGETDTLPTGRAEVMTGQACEGRCGGGLSFSLAQDDGTWTITSTRVWTG